MALKAMAAHSISNSVLFAPNLYSHILTCAFSHLYKRYRAQPNAFLRATLSAAPYLHPYSPYRL